MPIYEYECSKCGHHVEALQKFSDPPILECDRCHADMKKLISQSTFHLKGTGWYVTDYASKNSNTQMSSKETSSPTAIRPQKRSRQKAMEEKRLQQSHRAPPKAKAKLIPMKFVKVGHAYQG